MKKLFPPSIILFIFLIITGCSKDEDTITQHALFVEVNPIEGGSISPSSGKFEDGETVTLLATPSAEYVFKNWSGEASGTGNPTTIIMNSERTVTAIFEKRDYPLTMDIEGEGTVKEELVENTAASRYPSGSTVKLTAVPADSWEFVEWSGDLSGVDNPVTISINETRNVRAIFQPDLYNQIEGKWDQTNPIEAGDGSCLVYSLVFNSNGTFTFSLNIGQINGTYHFDSANSLVLDDQGKIENLSIQNNVLNFSLNLNNVCSFDGSAKDDPTYVEGECVSFLDCNDGNVWLSKAAEGEKFIRLTNNVENIWIEHYLFDEVRRCTSESMTNKDSDYSVVLVENNSNQMTYVLENTPEGDITVTLSNTADNRLAIKYDYSNNALDKTEYYSLVSNSSLEDYLNAYNVCPQATYVPDDNFEQALIDLGYDDVLDNYVLTNNIDVVESLVIIDKGITDLTGIEDFKSLVYLKTSDGVLDYKLNENANQITSIDVSKNTNLEYLDLGENKLKSLDISKNPNLTYLEIHFNEISTLDLSSNPKLELLSAGFNQLKTLDLYKNKNLINLQVFSNQLTRLDISGNPELEVVFAHNIPQSFYSYPYMNKLTSLDVSNNPNIKHLWFRNNNIATIDVSQNKALTVLIADNNQLTGLDLSKNGNLVNVDVNNNLLSRLDVSGNADLTSLNARNNPNLSCIQIDDPQMTRFTYWAKDASTVYSKDCSSLW